MSNRKRSDKQKKCNPVILFGTLAFLGFLPTLFVIPLDVYTNRQDEVVTQSAHSLASNEGKETTNSRDQTKKVPEASMTDDGYVPFVPIQKTKTRTKRRQEEVKKVKTKPTPSPVKAPTSPPPTPSPVKAPTSSPPTRLPTRLPVSHLPTIAPVAATKSIAIGKDLRIRDSTLFWNASIQRTWLLPPEQRVKNPPAMLLLTNYGWNQEDQKKALTIARTYRDTFLTEGVINHPWFHPTAWEDINIHNATIDPSIRYYVFLDRITCGDSLWPHYNKIPGDDTRHGRAIITGETKRCRESCPQKEAIMASRLFQESPTKVHYLDLNCAGGGPMRWLRDFHYQHYPKHLFVALSAFIRDMNHTLDQGLPVGACNPTELNATREKSIIECNDEANRSFNLVYIGNFRGGKLPWGGVFNVRGKLAELHDGEKNFVLRHFKPEFAESKLANWSFPDILANTVFGAVPRGDNKFSYRFAEVLSAGAIPVVLADDWLFPFRPEAVNWNQCAVIIPENRANQTLEILAGISQVKRCRMRRRCYRLYLRYFKTGTGVIDGVISGLEQVLGRGISRPLNGVHCIEGRDDPMRDCNFH